MVEIEAKKEKKIVLKLRDNFEMDAEHEVVNSKEMYEIELKQFIS